MKNAVAAIASMAGDLFPEIRKQRWSRMGTQGAAELSRPCSERATRTWPRRGPDRPV